MRILAAIALVLSMSGCVTTSERDSLPVGVTLLGSDEGRCDGPIEIEGDPDVLVDEGESTTIAVDEDDDDIEWRCLSDASPDEGELECPDGTEYLRITRQEDDSEFSLECFGG